MKTTPYLLLLCIASRLVSQGPSHDLRLGASVWLAQEAVEEAIVDLGKPSSQMQVHCSTAHTAEVSGKGFNKDGAALALFCSGAPELTAQQGLQDPIREGANSDVAKAWTDISATALAGKLDSLASTLGLTALPEGELSSENQRRRTLIQCAKRLISGQDGLLNLNAQTDAAATQLAADVGTFENSDATSAFRIALYAVLVRLEEAAKGEFFVGDMLRGSGWESYICKITPHASVELLESAASAMWDNSILSACIMKEAALRKHALSHPGDVAIATLTWALHGLKIGNQAGRNQMFVCNNLARYCEWRRDYLFEKSGNMTQRVEDAISKLNVDKHAVKCLQRAITSEDVEHDMVGYSIRGFNTGRRLGHIAFKSVTIPSQQGGAVYFLITKPGGFMMQIGHLQDARLHGIVRGYYASGRLYSECTFTNGEELGPEDNYFPDGTLASKYYRRDGEATLLDYWPNGQLARKAIRNLATNLVDQIEVHDQDGTAVCAARRSLFTGALEFSVGGPRSQNVMARTLNQYANIRVAAEEADHANVLKPGPAANPHLNVTEREMIGWWLRR
jgi:hypothetical protein